MSSKKLTKSPTFQQVFQGIEKAAAYGGIFPEMFKLINIMLTLPVGTAPVEVIQPDEDDKNQAPQPSKWHQSKETYADCNWRSRNEVGWLRRSSRRI